MMPFLTRKLGDVGVVCVETLDRPVESQTCHEFELDGTRHRDEKGVEKSLCSNGITMIGRARKTERKKQIVPVGVGKIHRFTSCICHGSPGIGRYERVDEWPRGNLPFPRYVHSGFSPLCDWITSWCRAPEEELLYVLYKLLELRLWPESLWASLLDVDCVNCDLA